jgi:hypothetical protein
MTVEVLSTQVGKMQKLLFLQPGVLVSEMNMDRNLNPFFRTGYSVFFYIWCKTIYIHINTPKSQTHDM